MPLSLLTLSVSLQFYMKSLIIERIKQKGGSVVIEILDERILNTIHFGSPY